jgi:hypothetical protein
MADYSGGSGQMARERPPQASRDGQKDGRLARIALIVGILAALATVVGVAWTIFNRENTEVADYQNQVSATCEQVRTVLAAEHNEVLVLGPGGIRVRKDLLLAVMRNNLDQARIAFRRLECQDGTSSSRRSAPRVRGCSDSLVRCLRPGNRDNSGEAAQQRSDRAPAGAWRGVQWQPRCHHAAHHGDDRPGRQELPGDRAGAKHHELSHHASRDCAVRLRVATASLLWVVGRFLLDHELTFVGTA